MQASRFIIAKTCPPVPPSIILSFYAGCTCKDQVPDPFFRAHHKSVPTTKYSFYFLFFFSPKLGARRGFVFDFLSAAICIKSYFLVYPVCVRCLAQAAALNRPDLFIWGAHKVDSGISGENVEPYICRRYIFFFLIICNSLQRLYRVS